MAELSFRKANIEDTPLILSFIRSLAEYEQMGNQVVATVDLLEEEIFTKHGAEVLLALEDGVEIGFALYFYNFSTAQGQGLRESSSAAACANSALTRLWKNGMVVP